MSTQEIEIKVPQLLVSPSPKHFIGEWYVKEGAYVAADGKIVGLETDKATFDIPHAVGGWSSAILKNAGRDCGNWRSHRLFCSPAEQPATSAATRLRRHRPSDFLGGKVGRE